MKDLNCKKAMEFFKWYLQRDAREGFRQHTEKIFLRSLNLSQEAGKPQDFSLLGQVGYVTGGP